jgi:hypothetical protein
MTINDNEADKTFTYFLLAYYFHWTPEQVDKTEYRLIDSMLTILPMWIQKTQTAGNNNG